MAYNYNIDKDKPPDTGESPSLGAQRIRHFKEALIERFQNWIYGFLSDSETDEGLKKAPLKAQDPAPSQEAGKMIVYAKVVGDIPELFARDKNGAEIQITSGGKLNPAGIDHGGLGGLQDDDHDTIYLNNARHDSTTRHPVSVIKFSTGSYSESIDSMTDGTPFTTNKYAHQLEFKGSDATAIRVGQVTVTSFWGYAPGTSWQVMKYIMCSISGRQTAYAQWQYHSASEQAIWGIWDKDEKKLVCVLVEKDEGYCKLFPELKANQILVKFKNAKKFLKEEVDPKIDKVKDKEKKKAKIKDRGFAGYIREDAQVTEEDIEEIQS